jgi:hypothetical protein
MSESAVFRQAGLEWRSLPPYLRAALDRRLEGMYGGSADDESIFDQLSIDKQQALLILARRFLALRLWEMVKRIENVYGEGGVGMNFRAWPCVKSTLERRGDFTQWFANHRDTSQGFIEKGTRRAALHILCSDSRERCWAAHFDLYNPLASPLNAWRHLLHEKFRGQTPGWQVIGASLGYLELATAINHR